MIRTPGTSGMKPMRVLIDTNVLFDVLCARSAFVEASGKVWRYCETGAVEGCVCALSIPNIVYILRKELNPEKVRQVIGQLNLIFSFTELKPSDLLKAAELGFGDYEDAVQSVCAGRIQAQYIVTRNIKDFKDSRVPAIRPEELLERL